MENLEKNVLDLMYPVVGTGLVLMTFDAILNKDKEKKLKEVV